MKLRSLFHKIVNREQARLSSLSCCQACGATALKRKRVVCTNERRLGIAVDFIICKRCGLSYAPTNVHEYTAAASFSAKSTPNHETSRTRVGNGETPGREYAMAVMGMKILAKPAPSILIVGPGLSRDYLLLGRQFPKSTIAVSDVGNFMGASNFVPLDSRDSQFDIVVACEVIEHFVNFESDFGNLLSKRRQDGLVIASTNVNNGHPLHKTIYPFSRGHTAYHTGPSLQAIASRFGLEVDFRAPNTGGPRKRYVIFGNPDGMRKTALHFSSQLFAPSERDVAL
jgi:hypothetical protein